MSKRTVCIFNSSKLTISHHSLYITQGENSVGIPLEDIGVLILETRKAVISSYALSAIVSQGACVMVCGYDHMPNGLLLPFNSHCRHASVVNAQLNMSKPMRKRIWQSIVKQKILNQAAVLEILQKDSSYLKQITKEVQSGDSSRRESIAAAYYFRNLLPEGGRRTAPYEGALDYGYSVLRSGIARSLVSSGWLVSMGIHHESELNPFNLVDDFIEPFRPVIDLVVIQNDIREPLNSEDKFMLAEVFEYLVVIDSKTLTVQNAIDVMVNSFKDAVLEKNYENMLLPSVIPLRKYDSSRRE